MAKTVNERAYGHFGVMLDCSRNAVMKVSEVKNFIDCLQKMGYNTLELYTEDTYELVGEPYFGYMRGRYTAAEIKEIDAYAKTRGVELIPCIQTLAHLNTIFVHEAYAGICDVNDILLIDEPKTYMLIEKMFKMLAENFTSRNVNIGMDEAHMVGLGKYLDKHGFVNRTDLLIKHLKKVLEIADRYGFTAHMWSDMFFRLASHGEYYVEGDLNVSDKVLAKVPESIELAYWDYYHTDKAFYDNMIAQHKKFNREIWFAGGAWTWNGFAPLNAFSLASMKPAMESVYENGIQNVFITMWGDDGKECSFYSVLPSLYAIRQFANGNTDMESIKKGFYSIFKVKFDDFMTLDIPNRTAADKFDGDKMTDPFGNPCKSLLFTDPFMGKFDIALSKIRAIPYVDYAKQLASAGKRAGKYAYIFESLSALCEALSVKAELGVKTRRAYDAKDKKAIAALAKDYTKAQKLLGKFHEKFYTLWHKENKSFGWEIQDARIGGLIRRLGTCAKELELFAKGKIERIDELEEQLLSAGNGDRLAWNNYAKNFTYGCSSF